MIALIVGLGSIAKKHIEALRKINPDITIYALRSSPDFKDYPEIISFYEVKELKKYRFDFAILCTPTANHKKDLELLLQLNCPLFIEKPIYHKLSIKETVSQFEKQQLLTYVGCNLRFLDSLVYVKKLLKSSSKRINEINVYCGSFLPSWRKDTDYKKSYSANLEMGGGVHIDLIHELDYVYWIFGRPVSVKSIFRNFSSLNISSYDYANYILEYSNFCSNIILNYYRKDSKRTLEILFEDDTITVDILKNTVFDSSGKIIYQSDQSISDTYQKQLEYFISCICNDTPTFNSISDGYEVLSICLKNKE